MKALLLTTAIALAATQVSAQSLKGAGSDFNGGYDWSAKSKSTQSFSPSSIPPEVWVLGALVVLMWLLNQNNGVPEDT